MTKVFILEARSLEQPDSMCHHLFQATCLGLKKIYGDEDSV